MDTTSSPEDRNADSGNTETPTGSMPDATPSHYSHLTREELEGALIRATAHLTTARADLVTANSAIDDGSDPRLIPFWEKARRISTHAGFCSEYDKIASALGGPQRRLAWDGVANVTATISLQIPISGIDTYSDVQDGEVTYEIDAGDVAEALSQMSWSRYDVDDWSDDMTPEIHHTEDAEDD